MASSDLTMCPVCLVPRKPGSKRPQLHYGGLCCMSCKAFFRRVVKMNLVARFNCKNDENCNFEDMKRYSCKKCRFLRCLQNGMDQEKVLKGEESQKFNYEHMKRKYQTPSANEGQPESSKVQNEAILGQPEHNHPGSKEGMVHYREPD